MFVIRTQTDSMTQASAYEQFLLELINAERAKVGAQPLALDGDLNEAAAGHSQWMIATDSFSHTGSGGSSAGQRMTAAGYVFSGSWTWGENIAWATTRSPTGYQDEVQLLHTNLMNSSGHRANLLNDSFHEIGLGFEVGEYSGRESAFLTEDFARSGSAVFLTGVAFDDRDGDRFYDPGEDLGGLTVTAVSSAGTRYTTTTLDAGGYDLALPVGTYSVTFAGSAIATTTMQATIGSKNVKLDLIDPGTGGSGTTPPWADDTLVSGEGDDLLDGGDGLDQCLFSGAFRQYTLTGHPTEVAAIVGPDGHDTLKAVENLRWVDGRLSFDPADHLAQIQRLYFATLDRAPDPLGLNYWGAQLDAGAKLVSIASGFVTSPEFRSNNGALNEGQFVEQLYANVLERTPSASEFDYWRSRLSDGASREQVVVGFSESPEHVQKHINLVNAGLWDINEGLASISRLYFGMLERTPEAAGLVFYEDRLANGLTVQQVANNFSQSPEFLEKYGQLTEAAYVRQLYWNVLERSPTPLDVDYHVSRLATGATRGDVAAGFTEALEYQIKTLPLVDHGIAIADAGFVLS